MEMEYPRSVAAAVQLPRGVSRRAYNLRPGGPPDGLQ